MPAKLPAVPPFNTLKFKKTLSINPLLKSIKTCFDQVSDSRKSPLYSLGDTLMSGFAIFSLKYASLLEFDNQRNEQRVKDNLLNLYGIKKTACDSQLRNILDGVNPKKLRPATIKTIQEVQKQGLLESYRYLGGFIVSIDGTGLFSSGHIHCEECCVKNHRGGEKTFYHQLLSSAIVNPDTNVVLPLLHEAITHQDGKTQK